MTATATRIKVSRETIADQYIAEYGWAIIPLALKTKNPAALGKGWEKKTFTPADFAGEGNIGVLTGARSGNLVDVDLDCQEAIAAAPHFLPPTQRIHGRKSKPRSHYWYQAATNLPATKTPYAERDARGKGNCMLVELRSSDGSVGNMTVIPPSVHESGEVIEWEKAGEPGKVDGDDLARKVSYVAATALLARHWPGEGSRHQCSCAVAGYLLRGGLDTATVRDIVYYAAEIAGDEEAESRARDVDTTAAKVADGGEVTGAPTLSDIIGEDMVKQLGDWLGLKSAGECAVVVAALPGAPGPRDNSVPKGYGLTESTTYKSVRETDRRGHASEYQETVAYAPVSIIGRLTDIDTGEESLRVAWCRDGWQQGVFSRGTLMNSREIVKLAAQGFPVNSANAGELVKYLTAFEAMNIDRLPVERVSSHMGWQGRNGDYGFLWGRKLITARKASPAVTFRGESEGAEQLVDGYHIKGKLTAWIDGVEPVHAFPKVLVGLYAAFVPPMLRIYHCANFTLDLSARTSVGKSTAQMIAASVVGNPDVRTDSAIIHTWNNTRVYVERLACFSTDVPVFLDDTKQAKRAEVVGEILYDFANGHGRGRGSTDGLARAGHWRSMLSSTGEAPAITFTNDGGTRGRVLTIKGLPFGSDNAPDVVRQLQACVSENYGFAFPLFVGWVLRHEVEWREWERVYRAEVKTWAENASGNVAGRLAAYMAAISYTAQLVHRAFAEFGYPLSWDYSRDTLAEVWRQIAEDTNDAPVEVRALQDVMNWATANERNFSVRGEYEPGSGWYGKWDKGDSWESICFAPIILKEFLTAQGYRPEEVFEGWRERKWLQLDANRKNPLRRIAADRNASRMVVVTRAAVRAVGASE